MYFFNFSPLLSSPLFSMKKKKKVLIRGMDRNYLWTSSTSSCHHQWIRQSTAGGLSPCPALGGAQPRLLCCRKALTTRPDLSRLSSSTGQRQLSWAWVGLFSESGDRLSQVLITTIYNYCMLEQTLTARRQCGYVSFPKLHGRFCCFFSSTKCMW